MTAAPSSRLALTMSESAEWGTPREVVALQRIVHGGAPQTDPASSAYWNRYTFGAQVFYDQDQDGRKQPWHGNVSLNPPGDRSGQLVREFWEIACSRWRAGQVDSVFWVGFSLEQLVHLQSSPMHPLQFGTLVPCNRLRFLQRPQAHTRTCQAELRDRHAIHDVTATGGRMPALPPCACPRLGSGPPEPGTAPTHGNYITLLPSSRSRTVAQAQLAAFKDGARSLAGQVEGALVRPV